MSELEQCIICLDPLPRSSDILKPPEPPLELGAEESNHQSSNGDPSLSEVIDEELSYINVVAALDGCDHIIHDACIRSWAQKTNTCPICRKPFNSVRVYNGIDGTPVSTYHVQDKKQVVDFDVQQWLGENPEQIEEESTPCPICNTTEHEDVLLLCDSCDAAYHTYCLGMEDVPEEEWYCRECRHLFELDTSAQQRFRRPQSRGNRGVHVRTRARQRRARRQARNVEWAGAWGQFSGRFYEMSEVDLDNYDDEDDDLEQFRRFQQLDRTELQRWQQRINIAHRLGASETFTNNIPPLISQHLQEPSSVTMPIQETPDERRAWGAFDRARDADAPIAGGRKRKARSITASPAEPAQEPERKLKRPRTRRLATQGEASNSAPPPVASTLSPRTVNGPSNSRSPPIAVSSPATDPPLVSSLLKELEPLENTATSDDEQAPAGNGWRGAVEASSPVMSPAGSAHSSPRALSITPPPLGRSASPSLSLSTNIEPRYPPANYSPNRQSGDHSDSENRPGRSHNQSPELRQPRPQRFHRLPVRKNEELSPTRATMTQEEKKSINDIVKTALRPHWRAQRLTTEQYASINRDISRKLYEQVKDTSSLVDNESRKNWEIKATQEVAQAVAGLMA